MRRIVLDTEFSDLPWTGRSALLWVGLADESGKRWSAVSAGADLRHCSAFVRDQVLPQIPPDEPSLGPSDLASAVIDFCGEVDQFWAWFPDERDLQHLGLPDTTIPGMLDRYADWDFQLLRHHVHPWPRAWPRTCQDLHRLACATGVLLPANPRPHHPAFDAAWGCDVLRAADGNPPLPGTLAHARDR